MKKKRQKVKKFKQVKSNQWVQPVRKGYLMACCDCSLVHKMDFRIALNQKTNTLHVQMKAIRDEANTKRLRKKVKKNNKSS